MWKACVQCCVVVLAPSTMKAMADSYAQLLDATIRHLEGLKERGVRFVSVSPENLAALAQAPRPQAAQAGAPSRAPVAPSSELTEREALVAAPLVADPVQARPAEGRAERSEMRHGRARHVWR